MRVPLARDPDREIIRAADLRGLVQRNRQAADAVAASNLPPAASGASACARDRASFIAGQR